MGVQFLDELRVAPADAQRRRVGMPRIGEQRPADAFAVLDQAVDLRHQMLRGEGFLDVGVGAVLQAAHLVLDGGLRRELDDGNMAVTQFRLDVFAQLVAVHLGHHDVAHDQVAVVVGEHLQRFFAVGGGEHLVTGGDDLGDHAAQIVVILHDQYLTGSALLCRSGGGSCILPGALLPRSVRRTGLRGRKAQRNFHGENGPAPLAVGAHDASAVLDGQQARQGQPDTGSALAVARLVEGVEDAFHILGNNALPVVGNRDAEKAAVSCKGHAAVTLGVLQRIG